MMRKISVLLAALVLCAAPALSLAAPGGWYALDGLDIALSMPENALVFTRGVAADDPDLAFIGYTQQEILDLMQENDSYLEAVGADWEYGITVTMTKSAYVSMSVMNEQKLDEAISSIQESYADDGAQVLVCEPYDSGGAVFLRILYSYTEDNYTEYLLEYYTIYNNRNISVTMFSYLGEVTAGQQDLMKGIVDGMQFTAGDPKAVKGGNGGGALINLTGNEDIDDIISLVAMLVACMLPVFFFRMLGNKGVIPEKAADALGIILSILVCVGGIAYSAKTGRSSGYVIWAPAGAIANAVRASARGKARRKAQSADRSGPGQTLEPSIPAEGYAAQMDARLAGVQADRRAGAARPARGEEPDRGGRIVCRCPACGEELASGAVFCGACGKKLDRE